jgi:hypothetical protein
MIDSIGIIGANGFVGKKFCSIFEKNKILFKSINRDNYSNFKEKNDFNIVINCAMPSARFWSKNNPNLDFQETVIKTHNIKNDFKQSKVIQISSISARVQLDTVYGRHKRAAELILEPEHDLIIRLGPIYDPSMSKGALIDIIKGDKVFISSETKYAFTPLDWVCSMIFKMKDKIGIHELGAKNYIKLSDLKNILNSKSSFEGYIDDQVFPNATEECPDASEVIEFAQNFIVQ